MSKIFPFTETPLDLRLGTPPDLDLGPPHLDLDLGPPTPPSSGPGTPHLDLEPPHLDLDLGPPPLRPGPGTPHPKVNRQTFPSINITFPRTTYTGGKNYDDSVFTQVIANLIMFPRTHGVQGTICICPGKLRMTHFLLKITSTDNLDFSRFGLSFKSLSYKSLSFKSLPLSPLNIGISGF